MNDAAIRKSGKAGLKAAVVARGAMKKITLNNTFKDGDSTAIVLVAFDAPYNGHTAEGVAKLAGRDSITVEISGNVETIFTENGFLKSSNFVNTMDKNGEIDRAIRLIFEFGFDDNMFIDLANLVGLDDQMRLVVSVIQLTLDDATDEK